MKKRFARIISLCLLAVMFISLCGCSFSVGTKINNIIKKADYSSYLFNVRKTDGMKYEQTAKKFNGTDTLFEIDVRTTKSISVDLKITKGKLSLVYVDKNGEKVLTDKEYNGTIDLSQYQSGTLKIKGEDAELTLEIYKW